MNLKLVTHMLERSWRPRRKQRKQKRKAGQGTMQQAAPMLKRRIRRASPVRQLVHTRLPASILWAGGPSLAVRLLRGHAQQTVPSACIMPSSSMRRPSSSVRRPSSSMHRSRIGHRCKGCMAIGKDRAVLATRCTLTCQCPGSSQCSTRKPCSSRCLQTCRWHQPNFSHSSASKCNSKAGRMHHPCRHMQQATTASGSLMCHPWYAKLLQQCTRDLLIRVAAQIRQMRSLCGGPLLHHVRVTIQCMQWVRQRPGQQIRSCKKAASHQQPVRQPRDQVSCPALRQLCSTQVICAQWYKIHKHRTTQRRCSVLHRPAQMHMMHNKHRCQQSESLQCTSANSRRRVKSARLTDTPVHLEA